jgi:hypothetical protein
MRFLLPLSVVTLWLAQSNDAFQLPATTTTANQVPLSTKTKGTTALFSQSNDENNNSGKKRQKVANAFKKSLAFLTPIAIAGSSVGALVGNPQTANAGAPVMAMPKTKAQDPVQVAFDLKDKKLMMEAQKELTDFQAKARAIEKESGPAARDQFEKEYKEAQSRNAEERKEGLVKLKRDLLDQGIDPALDNEGKRQVIFYNRGVDLGEISGTKFNVEKRYEAIDSPEAFAVRKKANRQIIKAMVQDLKNRGQDPLKYFEIHQDKTDMILNLPAEKAAALSAKYNENLELYGQIAVPKEGEKSAKELMAERGDDQKGSSKEEKKRLKAEAKAKAASEKAATKAAAKAEKERVKEEKAAAKEAAKAEKDAVKEAAAVAAAAAAASAAASTAVAAAEAVPSVVENSGDGAAVATIEQSTDETAMATTSEKEESSGGLSIVPAAGVVVAVGGGAYAFKMVRDNAAVAEEERQRQFRMLMGGDVVASSDTKTSTEDDGLVDFESEIDGTPEPIVEAAPPKQKKRRGLKSVFGKKSNGRETNIDNLVAPDTKAADFSKTLAKILTFGAPGRFPYISGLPGAMPIDSFDQETASSILTEAQAEAGITKEESAEIFANVVNCMLIDIVDLASTSLKEKDEKVTTDAIGIVITFMDLAASLYTSIAEGVDIVPVTYGGDISKSKLEQMYSTYAISGMADMASMDEKFDDRVSLLQDVFQINPKKAEGLMMKAMQKNMMEMMKDGKMPEGMEELMGGMGDMEGMGMPGMDGEEPDPEQLKEMLRALKDLKDSGSLPESELVEVRKQFKEAFGSSLDEIMKDANDAGDDLGSQDKELLDLMKDILE